MDAYSLVVLNVVEKPVHPRMNARAEDRYYARCGASLRPPYGLLGSLATAVLVICWALVGTPLA